MKTAYRGRIRFVGGPWHDLVVDMSWPQRWCVPYPINDHSFWQADPVVEPLFGICEYRLMELHSPPGTRSFEYRARAKKSPLTQKTKSVVSG